MPKPKSKPKTPPARTDKPVSKMLVVTDPDDAFRTTIDLVEDYLNKGMLIPHFLLRYLIDGVRGRLYNLRDTDSQLASKQAEFVKEKLGKLTTFQAVLDLFYSIHADACLIDTIQDSGIAHLWYLIS